MIQTESLRIAIIRFNSHDSSIFSLIMPQLNRLGGTKLEIIKI